MANYATLKAAVQAVVKSNGNKEITGTNMQSTLLGMITSLASGYLYKGVCTTSTSPGTPDENVFYIGGAGTYTNFGDSFTVNPGTIGVFRYNGTWSKTRLTLFDGIDEAPIADSSKLVKSSGIFRGIADAVSPIDGIKPETGFISSGGTYNTNGTGYIIPVSPGDSVFIKNTSASYSSFYAFLTSGNRPYALVDGTRYSIAKGTEETVTIPSGCHAVWIADSYQALVSAYTPARIMVNGIELLVSQIGNKHIIYGNDFIPEKDVTSLSDVLGAIPLNFRSELAIMQWRDRLAHLHLSTFVSQRPNVDANWTNTEYWKEIAFQTAETNDESIYPLYFSRDKMSYVKFMNNLELGSDGDSFECEVTCGIDTNLHGGFGFSQNPVQANKIAIGVSFEKLNIRADDGEYILSYAPFKWHYKFKMQFSGESILFYVDDELVSIFDNTNGKKVTISHLGYVSTTYGYWNGTIHWLKVNGVIYTSNYAIINTADEPDTPSMYAEKSASDLTIYRQYDGLVYVALPMIHAIKPYTANEYPSYYDNWGLRQPSLCYWNGTSMIAINTLFRNGEAELAVQVKDANNHMNYVGGSTHGFENINVTNGTRELSIIVDNKAVGETDEFGMKPVRDVVIRQFSQMVPAYTNSNPFANVVKVWKFGDMLSIYSSVRFTRDILSDRLMQGMFCIYRHLSGNTDFPYLTNRAVKDNTPYIVYDVSDGWNDLPVNDGLKAVDHDCSEIYEYGETDLGISMSISDDNRDASGGMFVSTNDSSYNKIYYAAKHLETEVAADTEYHATQTWSFL